MLLRAALQQKSGALEDARAALVTADAVADVARKGADEAMSVVKAEWLAVAARAKVGWGFEGFRGQRWVRVLRVGVRKGGLGF